MSLPKFNIKQERWAVAGFTTAFIGIAYFSADLANIYLSKTSGRIVNLNSEFDAHIPFIPIFIFAYVSYYFYPILFPFIVRNRSMLYQTAFSLILLQIVATMTFIMVPSHIDRPVIEGDEFIPSLIRFIYSLDSGYNLLPSLHVAHSTVVTLVCFNAKHFLRYAVLACTILICCSTVFIKQHFIIDIPFGLLYAFVSYYVASSLVRALEKPLELQEEINEETEWTTVSK